MGIPRPFQGAGAPPAANILSPAAFRGVWRAGRGCLLGTAGREHPHTHTCVLSPPGFLCLGLLSRLHLRGLCRPPAAGVRPASRSRLTLLADDPPSVPGARCPPRCLCISPGSPRVLPHHLCASRLSFPCRLSPSPLSGRLPLLACPFPSLLSICLGVCLPVSLPPLPSGPLARSPTHLCPRRWQGETWRKKIALPSGLPQKARSLGANSSPFFSQVPPSLPAAPPHLPAPPLKIELLPPRRVSGSEASPCRLACALCPGNQPFCPASPFLFSWMASPAYSLTSTPLAVCPFTVQPFHILGAFSTPGIALGPGSGHARPSWASPPSAHGVPASDCLSEVGGDGAQTLPCQPWWAREGPSEATGPRPGHLPSWREGTPRKWAR